MRSRYTPSHAPETHHRPRLRRGAKRQNVKPPSARPRNARPRTNNSKHPNPHPSNRHRRNPRRRNPARRPWSGPPSAPMGACSRANKRATCGPWIHTPATPALTATHTSKACARPLSSAAPAKRENCPAEQPGSLCFGGANGIRTRDPHTASVVRYQLRHSPMNM